MADTNTVLHLFQEDDIEAQENCCPIRDVLDQLGDKWSMLLVVLLSERPQRFGELRKRIPDISQRMLTETLRSLTRNGLATRTVYPTRPPSVEYALTQVGESLLTAWEPLIDWATSHRGYIRASRTTFDAS